MEAVRLPIHSKGLTIADKITDKATDCRGCQKGTKAQDAPAEAFIGGLKIWGIIVGIGLGLVKALP